MDRLIFTSLSATTTGSMSRVQLTNDLANVSTTGFKRAFDIRPAAGKLAGPGFETRYQPVITDVNNFINLEAGVPIQTDNPLDVSMNDKTVLGVQAKDGSLAFTRRGDLRLSQEGFLETANGYLVATEGGGPLTVPVGGTISITPDGTVFFQADGGLEVPPQEIGQLLLRDTSATTLTRRVDTLFEEVGSGGLGGDIAPGPEIASLTVGALEGSNVNPVGALVSLMDYYRAFETQMKIIKSAEDIDKDATRLMRAS